MKDPTGTPVVGKTRWRRFLILFGPGFGVVTLMMYLVATGALAVNLAISGMPFKLSAHSLSGSNFIQFAAPDKVTNPNVGGLVSGLESANGITPPGAPGQIAWDNNAYLADTETYLQAASIDTLHQTVCAPLPVPPGLSSFWSPPNLQVTIDAGAGGSPATADSLIVQAPALAANSAVFKNIVIGRDAADAITGFGYGAAPTGTTGLFSQAASSVTITGLTQIAVGTEAGTFTLPGLTLSASFVGSC